MARLARMYARPIRSASRKIARIARGSSSDQSSSIPVASASTRNTMAMRPPVATPTTACLRRRAESFDWINSLMPARFFLRHGFPRQAGGYMLAQLGDLSQNPFGGDDGHQ